MAHGNNVVTYLLEPHGQGSSRVIYDMFDGHGFLSIYFKIEKFIGHTCQAQIRQCGNTKSRQF